MCTVTGGGELLRPEKRMTARSSEKKCMKCHDNDACVVIRMNDPLCSECFLSYTSHKFRSAFGKSKLIRDQEKVLVAVSGGQSSSAMIHLIETGLSKRAQKKLRFIPHLLFIDEGAVLGQSVEDRCSYTQQVAALVKTTGQDILVSCIEQSMTLLGENLTEEQTASAQPLSDSADIQQVSLLKGNDLEHQTDYIQLHQPDCEKLEKLLSSVKSLTAKENLINHLRKKLLAAIGRKLGMFKIMIGDSATRLSVDLLSNITQGQGKHLHYHMGFADSRYGDITFIRPMREFSAKEISMYNRLHKITSVFIPTLDTKVPSQGSIGRLTEDFVLGLQAEYPNTVSTIFRTGEKFDVVQGMSASDEESDTVTELCCLCQCPLDTTVGDSSALAATNFSLKLCQNMRERKQKEQTSVAASTGGCENMSACPASDRVTGEQVCCGEGDGSCHQSKVLKRIEYEDLEPWLCYGCRLVAKDLKRVDCLPDNVLTEAAHRAKRAELKQQISEYLLE